jgi:hypothetical protein
MSPIRFRTVLALLLSGCTPPPGIAQTFRTERVVKVK